MEVECCSFSARIPGVTVFPDRMERYFTTELFCTRDNSCPAASRRVE